MTGEYYCGVTVGVGTRAAEAAAELARMDCVARLFVLLAEPRSVDATLSPDMAGDVTV